MMASVPAPLRGEVAGSSTRGVESVTLEDAGKAMTRERGTEAARDTVELHWRVELEVGAAVVELHAPAVAAVIDALDQQAQEAQPSV